MHQRDRERGQDHIRDPGSSRVASYLFKSLWPFHLFQDASRGDMFARAAAYRHNRRMRGNLPGYLAKWTVGSLFAWLSVCGFDALAAAPVGSQINVFTLMAAGCGIVFAYAVCVMVVTLSAYLYLSQHEQ
jgi:hypothetical protein